MGNRWTDTDRLFVKDTGEPKQQYPAKPEPPDKYTSYHLYISDDLINEIVTIGKQTLMDIMPYIKKT